MLKDAPWVVPQDVQRVALTGKPHLAQAVALEDLIQALCIKKAGSFDAAVSLLSHCRADCMLRNSV